MDSKKIVLLVLVLILTVASVLVFSLVGKGNDGDGGQTQEMESEMLAMINEYRSEVGAPLLVISTELNDMAEIRAKESVELFSHTRPDGTSYYTVLRENDVTYKYSGENLASGPTSVNEVMVGWYNSPGHKENMLNPNFGQVGFCCYEEDGMLYWAQIFTD